MCWGNYWPLGFRRVFATFTGALYEDRFYLIVWKNVKVGGFVASLSKPFEPFTIELWVLVLSSFAFVGILMTWEAKRLALSPCGPVALILTPTLALALALALTLALTLTLILTLPLSQRGRA